MGNEPNALERLGALAAKAFIQEGVVTVPSHACGFAYGHRECQFCFDWSRALEDVVADAQ
jgi:hypothetical protein